MSDEAKVAVVTGVTGKFGRGIGLELAERGWRVVGTGRRAERGDLFAKEVSEAGGEATFVAGDVSRVADCHQVARSALAAYGRIDLLVNSAATLTDPPFIPSHELTEEAWDRVLGTNLKGAFFCSAAVLPTMIEQGSGNIINIASAHGQNVGPPEMTAYVTSKAGMISLTKSMAVEYAARGIRINTIVLGAAEGESAYRVEDQRGRETRGEEYVGASYDERDHGGLSGRSMAATIAYLASDEASYINGSAVTVDNGLSAGGYWAWVVAGMRSLGSPRSGVSPKA